MQLIGAGAASFALCLLATLALRPVAVAIDLIDRPGGRKTHVGDIPVVGGLSMLLGMTLGFGLMPWAESAIELLLSICAVLVTIGLIDDRFGLSPLARLSAQCLASVVMMVGAGSVVVTIGSPFGGADIAFTGMASYGFTILAVAGAINAFNMLDGMDGLAGAMAIVALTCFALLAYDGGLLAVAGVSIVTIGAVLAFLLSNLPIGVNRNVLCFMGDSGSTLLGFTVAWLCVTLSQSPLQPAAPVTILWIVALPLYELVWTVIRRALRGISPFTPDTEHLHHVLRAAGFGVREAFVVFSALAILLAGFGVAIDRMGVPDVWSFGLLILAGVGVVRLIYRPDVLRALLRRTAPQPGLPQRPLSARPPRQSM